MKKLIVALIIILPFAAVYLLGPKVETPDLSITPQTWPADLNELDAKINQLESENFLIRTDNESRISWADSIKIKTEYSLVYLHGWSASQAEGDPLHKEIAERYGMNLYLPRLAGHGLTEEEPMLSLTGTDLLKSAKDAVEIGKIIGEKVIVMGTSTGGTLALYLASQDEAIESLILYSPNVDIKDGTSVLLDDPWGLELARMVKGSNYHEWDLDSPRVQYWTNKYRLEALTHLRELVDVTMTEDVFSKVIQPVFLGYYYKDEENQDDVVSVDAMLDMYEQLGTPKEVKVKVAFPEVGHHVIGSYMTSKDLPSVRKATFNFMDEKLGLEKTNSN